MKWCNSQASASCFNSQVQTSCASFSMALLLLKMLALGWGARKNVQRKGLNTNQLIWLKSLMPESMRCLNDQAQWSDAKWSLHASVSHWSCSARLKHFLLQFDKKMLSNLKTLSKIKSKSHTHTHASVQILTKTQESCVWMWNPQWHARTVGSKTWQDSEHHFQVQCALWKLNHLPVPVLVERCKTNWCHLRANNKL